LLVVVAIISLLTSIVLASLKDARNKARASQTLQTLLQIRTAAELYKNDTGVYPSPGNLTSVHVLIPNYIPTSPKNPFTNSTSYWLDIESSTSSCSNVDGTDTSFEVGKLFVYAGLSTGNTPVGLFNKYRRSFSSPNWILYDGKNPLMTSRIQPCVE
jgi:type II secretory pathway pseudopilin PulG